MTVEVSKYTKLKNEIRQLAKKSKINLFLNIKTTILWYNAKIEDYCLNIKIISSKNKIL